MAIESRLDTLYRGDSRVITLNVVTSSGVAVPLTGKTVVMTIAKVHQAVPLAVYTNTPLEHEDALGGVTKFIIPTADSISAEVSNYHIDVVMFEDADPTVTTNTIFVGQLRIENRVSIPETP